MKPSSAKAKGRRLQTEVMGLILQAFPELEPDDVRTAIMGESGEDIKLSPAARRCFPFAVECKYQERLPIWKALEQCESNAGPNTPLLIFRRNRSKTYAVLQLDDLLNLLRRCL